MDMETDDEFQEDHKQFEREEEEDEEEEEFEYYESEEEQRSKETSQTKGKKKKKKKKRNRKSRRKSNKPLGHHRNIKSKYDGIKDLNLEALLAQNEELERIIKRSKQLQHSNSRSGIVLRHSRDHRAISTSDSKSPSKNILQ